MDKGERFAHTGLGFFEHEWVPPEEDDEDLPATERKFREINWVWEGVLPRGGTSIVSAAPKVGKTTFVANLAVAHARGDGVFLGRKLDQGITTLVILEGSPDEIIKTVKTLCKKESLPLWVRTFRPKSFEDAKAELRRIVKKDMPSLLCIDTLWKLVRSKDVTDYAGMAAGLELIDHLAREFGTHIMATHHDKKNSKGNASDVLGSTAIVGGVDTVIQIARYKGCRKMWSTQRHGVDMEPMGIELKERELVVTDIFADLKTTILAFLSTNKNATMKQLVEACTSRTQEVLLALKYLLDEHKVRRTGRGTNHYPFYFNLNHTQRD